MPWKTRLFALKEPPVNSLPSRSSFRLISSGGSFSPDSNSKEKFSVDKYEDVPLRCGDIIIYEVNGMLKNTSKVYGTH